MNKPTIYDEYLKDLSITLTDKNIKDIYGYEIYLLNTLKLNFNPNKIIEEAISKKPGYSYHYAEDLLDVFKDINVIPKIIQEAISKDDMSSYWYAENLLKIYKDVDIIPKIIVEAISKDSYHSCCHAATLLRIFKDRAIIPKIIEEAISKDSVNSFRYIKFLNKSNINITDETFDRFKVYLIP